MLRLSRHAGEEILLTTSDGEVRIFVEKVRDRLTILGFEAPQSVRIRRAEVPDRSRPE